MLGYLENKATIVQTTTIANQTNQLETSVSDRQCTVDMASESLFEKHPELNMMELKQKAVNEMPKKTIYELTFMKLENTTETLVSTVV